MIPAALALRHKVFPIAVSEEKLTVAAADPFDPALLEILRLYTEKDIDPVCASSDDIEQAVFRCYGIGADTVEQMTPRSADGEEPLIRHVESEASVGKILNQILHKACEERATDIHFEPGEKSLNVRFRIDGILRTISTPGNLWHFREAVNARVKILSRLNIAEKRLPQDGKFKFKNGGNELDLRVSFIPSASGESMSIRILNSVDHLKLTELGLSPSVLYDINRMLNKNSGMIFVTGPTGSGKTSTLYAAIHRLDRDSKKIITIEDPPEYHLPGITQIQVHPAIGLTFAAGLRSVLRHDPDIILIGEVRDHETAQISIQSSLTGHLVLSTLHTNDAASGITRLLEIGIDPFLIASSVNCFIAQRLVRLICPECKEKDACGHPDFAEVYRGKGCEHCRFTGYQGRTGIFEFLAIDDRIRRMIMERQSAAEIRKAAVEGGMKLLYEHGGDKVKKGLTTPEEVLRVTQDDQ